MWPDQPIISGPMSQLTVAAHSPSNYWAFPFFFIPSTDPASMTSVFHLLPTIQWLVKDERKVKGGGTVVVTPKKRAKRSGRKSPCPADASGVAQAGQLTYDAVQENEARVTEVLDLLMDISPSMRDISSHLEATECYIQAREKSEGLAAKRTCPGDDLLPQPDEKPHRRYRPTRRREAASTSWMRMTCLKGYELYWPGGSGASPSSLSPQQMKSPIQMLLKLRDDAGNS